MLSRIAAHRGGTLEAPENTLGAFARALEFVVEEIECNVHLSSDGQILVHHDATLDRMTDRQGPLSNRTAQELRGLRIKVSAMARIPLLSEVLALLAPHEPVLRLELKANCRGRLYDGLAKSALADIDRAGLQSRSYDRSCAVDYLRAPAVADSGLPTLLLVETETFRDIGALDGLARLLDLEGTTRFALPIDSLSTELVASAQAYGLTVCAFGCHDDTQVEVALSLRLPVFTSGRPSVALASGDRILTPQRLKAAWGNPS